MTGIERLVPTTELKTSLWSKEALEKRADLFMHYSDSVDAFTLMVVSPHTPKRVHYIDDHVALLYRPDDREVIGLRIESFKKSFLPKYSELQKVWCLKDTGIKMSDFSDLQIEVRKREPLVAREVSKITHQIVEHSGLKMEPVPV